MMKLFDIHIHKCLWAALSLAALFAASCQDDQLVDPTEGGPSGKPALISLKVTAPDMRELTTRADMEEVDANNVTTLWIGIYNEATGECTYNHLYRNGENGFASGVKEHIDYSVNSISTKSGKSYIVAVANPDVNTGYQMGTDGQLTTSLPVKLSTLLEGATTWDAFRSIVIERPLYQDAASLHLPNATENPLPMSGTYYESADDAPDWTTVGSVYIPAQAGGYTLPGRIHLRRPFTQVKFNIQVAKNTDVVSIEPQSYRVYNVPTYSWLYERAEQPAQEGMAVPVHDRANAGDGMCNGTIGGDINKLYASSLLYTSTDISQQNGVYSFDFWQMENKRTGLESCTIYANREKEYKKDDGTNTGIYASLCPEATETLNNKATYVEIRCRVTYNSTTNLDNPTDDSINEGDLPTTATRTADAVYTVHLGYVGGDAKDFNCYRNSKYTYNVSVKSVNSIIVEAFRNNNGENRPDAEGIVADVTDRIFNLDAHYAAFNIQLTTNELQNFSYSMRAYNGNKQYEYYMREDGTTNAPAADSDEYPYYAWIELAKKTDGDGNTLLAYPGTTSTSLYRLGDIRAAAKRETNPLTGGWFTVFVNEYTYESSSNEGTNWREYVNQPNRMAYLNVAEHISQDKESSYFKSKYAVSQRSIQTYYNYLDATTANAIGVEHENETYGMNLRWTVGTTNIDADNGRYNVWTHIGGSPTDSNDTTADEWETYVQRTQPNAVNKIDNTNYTAEPKTWPLPMPVLITTLNGGNLSNNNGYSNAATSKASTYDPQYNQSNIQYLEAIRACMNRNRDNNGNNTIDADELRWYLPASGKYVRVILGRNSLSTPIMDYNSYPTLPWGATTGYNARFHLVSSDGKMIWADEGMSSSDFPGKTYGPAPWQVRCIRNLGTNLSNVSRGEKVDPAYDATDIDKTTTGNTTTVTVGGGGVIKVKHYYGSALRDYTAETLPIHATNSTHNKLGQYGFEIAPRGNSANITGIVTRANSETTASFNSAANYQDYIDKATPCSTLNSRTGRSGWRIPNQKELVIMRRTGLLTFSADVNSSYPYYVGCTREYWQNKATDAGSTSSTWSDYRITTIRKDNATAVPYNETTAVRCVRDLTPAEANMKYEDIKNYHPNPNN